ASVSPCSLIWNCHLPESHPANHAAQEAVALRHCEQTVNNFAVHQPKVARIKRHLRLRNSIDETIVGFRGPELESCLSFTFHALTVSYLVARAPAAYHFRDDFGRVLQVSINNNHCIARSIFKPSGHGYLVAEVARQAKDA